MSTVCAITPFLASPPNLANKASSLHPQAPYIHNTATVRSRRADTIHNAPSGVSRTHSCLKSTISATQPVDQTDIKFPSASTTGSPYESAHSIPELAELKKGATTLEFDVTAPLGELHTAAAKAVTIYGHIDIVVNNAGYLISSVLEENVSHRGGRLASTLLVSPPLSDISPSPEQTYDQFNTNVFGGLNIACAFLPYMRPRKTGTIVWIGSVGGYNVPEPVIVPQWRRRMRQSLSRGLHRPQCRRMRRCHRYPPLPTRATAHPGNAFFIHAFHSLPLRRMFLSPSSSLGGGGCGNNDSPHGGHGVAASAAAAANSDNGAPG